MPTFVEKSIHTTLESRTLSISSPISDGAKDDALLQNAVSSTSYQLLKRTMDIVLSFLAMLILSPIYLILAIAIKLDSPGPVIFVQDRVRGQQSPDNPHPEQQLFKFLKFRSMYTNADDRQHRQYVAAYINGDVHHTNHGESDRPIYKMTKDPRITWVGNLIRRTSLDELPQFFNVLRGDMSLVGPRPALPYEVEQYGEEHKQRLIPQAGLTGLWQVSGRTTLSFEEMIEIDVRYAHERSFWLDLKILILTIPAILSGDGAW